MPKTESEPPDRGETHWIIFIVVVFPAPFGPRNPKTSPFCTVNEIPSTATVPLNSFFSPEAAMISGIRLHSTPVVENTII